MNYPLKQSLPCRGCVCPRVKGFTGGLGLSPLFSQCVYQATRAWQLVCFITASTAASSGRWLCVLPARSLIHTYATVLICSPSLFLTRFLSLLSPVLLISRRSFVFLQRWVSEHWWWELYHSVGARLCHPEITYVLWFLLILYNGQVPSPLNEISHTFRKMGTKRLSTLLFFTFTAWNEELIMNFVIS